MEKCTVKISKINRKPVIFYIFLFFLLERCSNMR
jgi:hypothetical protein